MISEGGDKSPIAFYHIDGPIHTIVDDQWNLPILLLILACLVTYANGLHGDFVYDDVSVTVVQNPFLEGLVGWRDVLTWDRPIREFTYYFDHLVWGERPFGYHLQNLVWHTLNVVLLWKILAKIGMAQWPSCLCALLFAIHPVNTEAVTWISGRKELLCLFFELLTIWFFLRFLRSGSWPHAYAVGVLLSLCLALFSKQVAVVLPILLFATAWTQGEEFTAGKSRVVVLITLVAMVTAVLALTALRGAEVAREALERGTYYDPAARGMELQHPVLTGLAVWALAIRLFIVPYPLVVERTVEPVLSWGDPRWMIGALLVLLWFALLWRYRNRSNPGLGIAWLGVTWLPTSGILPATYLLSDRYLYIPCVGFCWVLGYALYFLLRHHSYLLRRIGIAVATVAVVSYTWLAVDRNRDWSSELSLWGSAVQHEPANPKVHFNLGNAYMDEGKFALAEDEWNTTLELEANYPQAHVNLGALYQKRGDLHAAESHYQAALDAEPDYGVAQFNLATLYEEFGKREEAIQLLKEAAKNIGGKRDTPQKKARVLRELARVLFDAGQVKQAREAAERSLYHAPEDPVTRRLYSAIRAAEKES